MSYEPTIWKKGDKVTSARLNKIENGIQGNDSEITALKEGLTYYLNPVFSYNLYKGDWENGYINSTGSIITGNTPTYAHMTPILLGTGDYLFASARGVFGEAADKYYVFDSEGNYVSQAACTVLEQISANPQKNLCKFTLTESKYISLNIGYQTGHTGVNVDSFMLVRGTTADDYPDFQEYFDPYSASIRDCGNGLTNIIGKEVVFDGDSICASDGIGYAGRIGNANFMKWHNEAVAGGVITSALNAALTGKHSVVDNVGTLYSKYPNADYVIFEGGTNDADLLGGAISNPSNLGTYDPVDFVGPFDKTTFSGAFDELFSKATSYWVGKKIGFVVAQKMGKYSGGYTKDVNNRRCYFERAIDLCKKWGIPYINLWDNCYLNPSNPSCYDSTKTVEQNIEGGYLYKDGQHLTNKGYDYISPMIEAWIKTL